MARPQKFGRDSNAYVNIKEYQKLQPMFPYWYCKNIILWRMNPPRCLYVGNVDRMMP